MAKNSNRMDELKEKLLEAAHSISIDLGWHPGHKDIRHLRSS